VAALFGLSLRFIDPCVVFSGLVIFVLILVLETAARRPVCEKENMCFSVVERVLRQESASKDESETFHLFAL